MERGVAPTGPLSFRPSAGLRQEPPCAPAGVTPRARATGRGHRCHRRSATPGAPDDRTAASDVRRHAGCAHVAGRPAAPIRRPRRRVTGGCSVRRGWTTVGRRPGYRWTSGAAHCVRRTTGDRPAVRSAVPCGGRRRQACRPGAAGPPVERCCGLDSGAPARMRRRGDVAPASRRRGHVARGGVAFDAGRTDAAADHLAGVVANAGRAARDGVRVAAHAREGAAVGRHRLGHESAADAIGQVARVHGIPIDPAAAPPTIRWHDGPAVPAVVTVAVPARIGTAIRQREREDRAVVVPQRAPADVAVADGPTDPGRGPGATGDPEPAPGAVSPAAVVVCAVAPRVGAHPHVAIAAQAFPAAVVIGPPVGRRGRIPDGAVLGVAVPRAVADQAGV